jgi:hypothetical protein
MEIGCMCYYIKKLTLTHGTLFHIISSVHTINPLAAKSNFLLVYS